MSKTTYEKFGDIMFPVTRLENGVTFLDYPMCLPRPSVGKTTGLMSELTRIAKEKGFTIIYSDEQKR